MDSSKLKLEAGVKVEPQPKEEEFIIDSEDEIKIEPARIRPVKVEDFKFLEAEPRPSTSGAALAEVRLQAPPAAPDYKWDPYELGPRANRLSPPPPADRAKRRSVPGGHASAKPRIKFVPYQPRR